MKVGALSRHVEAAIEVGRPSEVGLELGHGLVGFEFVAPVATAGGEEACLFDDSVASSDGAGVRDRVVSNSTPYPSSLRRSVLKSTPTPPAVPATPTY
jgi:hypothetical protein